MRRPMRTTLGVGVSAAGRHARHPAGRGGVPGSRSRHQPGRGAGLPGRPAQQARLLRQGDRAGPRHRPGRREARGEHQRPARPRRPSTRSAWSSPAAPTPRSGRPARSPGVTYLEGNQPIELFRRRPPTRPPAATRRCSTLTGADGSGAGRQGRLGRVIDSGVDPTHPYLPRRTAGSAVVSNHKVLCDPFEAGLPGRQRARPASTPTRCPSAGTARTSPASSPAAPTTLSDGTKLHGAAPGAKLVSLSTGAVLVIIGADSALNWVLENHDAPAVPASRPPSARRSRSPTTPTARAAAASSTRSPRR